jgi:AcrR family transcriptional regulator
MGIAERQTRDKEALRHKILQAAGELFVEQGYENVSLRKVAEKIEYAPSTIYLYFKDKAELLGSICLETFAGLNERLDEIETRKLPPLAGLEAGLRTYIRFGLEHPNHYLATFTFRPPSSCPKQLCHMEPVDQVGFQSFDYMRRSVRNAMDAGVIRKAELEVTCQSLWMLIHGVTTMCIQADNNTGFPWETPDKLIDFSLDLIIRGLLPDS